MNGASSPKRSTVGSHCTPSGDHDAQPEAMAATSAKKKTRFIEMIMAYAYGLHKGVRRELFFSTFVCSDGCGVTLTKCIRFSYTKGPIQKRPIEFPGGSHAGSWD
jgi:hypothetical protein